VEFQSYTSIQKKFGTKGIMEPVFNRCQAH
jgi:hypothetical protein